MAAAALLSTSLTVFSAGCATRDSRALRKASRKAGKAIRKADAESLRDSVVIGARDRVDYAAILADASARSRWSGALAKPVEARAEATVMLTPEHPVRAVEDGSAGWSFAEDPTVLYSQTTPRAALRSFVKASRMSRWDVLLELAPERYRIDLSEDELRAAWTEGEYSKDLQSRRDRLAGHLADPIVSDSHMATLRLDDGDFALLEREGHRWVVVDF